MKKALAFARAEFVPDTFCVTCHFLRYCYYWSYPAELKAVLIIAADKSVLVAVAIQSL